MQQFTKLPLRFHLAFWSLILILTFTFYGGRSLRESSEARYGEVAREMIESSDWVTPHLHGQEHYTKPPVSYWLIAMGLKVGGINEWGARLPLPFAFLLTIISLYGIARNMNFTEGEALSACLIYATSGFSFLGSFVLTADPFLTASIAAGMWAFWSVRKTGKASSLVLFWIIFGVSFLIKGPPAWLHLLPIVVICWLKPAKSPRKQLNPLYGIPLMILIGCSWFFWLILQHPELFRYFLVDEFVNRVATADHGRDKSPLIYPLILIGGLFPWIFLVATPEFWKKTGFKTKKASSNQRAPVWKLFCIIWIIFPLIVFLFAKSRMPLYVLPLFLPLSLLLGKQLPTLLPKLSSLKRKKQRVLVTAGLIWIGFLLIARATPDSFDSKRAFKQDGIELSRTLNALPREHELFWLYHRPYHGLAFYMNQTIKEADTDNIEKLLMEESLGTKQETPVYVMRKRDIEDLPDSVNWQVLASSERMALVSLSARNRL